MLRAIRNKAQGWIAWVIVILISIPFALFGIQEYLGVSSDPVIAVVDGEDIPRSALDRRVRGFRDNMRRMLGDNYRADLFDDAALQERMLQTMVTDKVLEQAIADWNMQPGDAQIRDVIQGIPAFQRDGAFDPVSYRNTLRNQGMTSAYFEQQIRQDIAVRQFQEGWEESQIITEQQLADFIRLKEQTRDIRYAHMPTEVVDPATITEAQAQAYYQQQQTEFLVPERVKLAYLHLSADTLAARVEVEEAALQTYFEAHQNEFIVPEERKIRHILIGSKVGDEAAQLAQAEALLAEIRAGADFAELAAVHSEDPGSGGSLGWMGREAFVKPFADSAFTLAEADVSEPIKTTFGYHLIQVEAIRGGDGADFASQRDKITAAYRQQQAEALYYDEYERLAEVVYENPDSLVAAAEMLDMPVQETDWLERGSALSAPFEQPKVQQAIYSEDVIQGNNSDVIERGPVDAVVLRVIAHEPATRKPFDLVQEQIVARLAEQQARAQTEQRGQAAVQQWRDGADLADIAGVAGEIQTVSIDREATDLPLEIVQAAFAEVVHKKEKRSYTGTAAEKGGYYLIAVEQVTDGDIQTLAEEQVQTHRTTLNNQHRPMEQLRAALRARAEVSIQAQ